jgi:hypothetical protein
MHSKRDLFERDLYTLEVMIIHLPNYLLGDSTAWEVPKEDIPKLTIGGCLMRQHRLRQLQKQLTPLQQERLDNADTALENIMNNHVVRFEQKCHQELHARLGEWMECLRYLSRHTDEEGAHYADKVDTRVVISALITQMQQAPFKLEQQILTQVATLDGNLRQRWQSGEFIWIQEWQRAYPAEVYWFLYGLPR